MYKWLLLDIAAVRFIVCEREKPQWFLDFSPTGRVPLLINEAGEALFESDAIVEYIDEITIPLVADVSPEQRARDRAWS